MAIADVSEVPVRDLVSLTGRGVVVTGGAQGLGRAMVRRLAEAGAAVLIGDLKEELACAAAAELAITRFGRLDVWVNNAGLYPNVKLLKMTDQIWNEVMDVNLRGVFVGAREAAKRMIIARRGGVILNVVSTAGFRGVAPGVAAYVASKHGVRGLTRQLAIELAPHEIRVLGVAPTFCTTEGNMAALAELERVGTQIPATLSSRLGRVGVPDDVGRPVLFCASDMSIFMTGSTLLVDAGEIS